MRLEFVYSNIARTVFPSCVTNYYRSRRSLLSGGNVPIPVKAHVPAERYSQFETGDLVSSITRKSDTRAFTQKLVETRSLR